MWSFKKPSIFSNTSKILPFEAPKSFACVGGVKKTGWVDTSNSYDLFISSLSGLTVKIQALIVKIQIKAFSMSLIILFSK